MNDSVELAYAMHQHLNNFPSKPCEIKLEALDKHAPSMMMQQLGGATVVKKYVNGSFVGRFPFAVYIRITNERTINKIDAVALLNDVASWLEATKPFIGATRRFTSVEVTAAPTIASRYEDGTEDYQILFEMKYHQGGTT